MSDMESIGVVMFLKMFETHPETLSSFIKNVYSIKEIEMNEWYVNYRYIISFYLSKRNLNDQKYCS